MPLSANLVVVALITVVLAFWTASWRASRRPGARATVLSLAFLDLALVIGPIEIITGLLNQTATLWGIFGVHVFALIAGYWLVVSCQHLASSPPFRGQAGLLVLTLVVLFGLFLAGPVSEHLDTIASAYGSRPFVLPYLVVFAVYLSWVQIAVAVSSMREWNSEETSLRWGARLRTVGAVAGTLFCVHRALYTLLVMIGVQPPWPDYGASGVGNLLMIVAIVLQLAGVMAARKVYASR